MLTERKLRIDQRVVDVLQMRELQCRLYASQQATEALGLRILSGITLGLLGLIIVTILGR